ncbi:hypothetical protein ACUXZZ_29465 [Streptomyces graminifolii]|uniref:hypothetical protein n=1 Tax=Streptomyces graminifolii TaxID=1266771 RepID=UPI0040593275
MEHAATSSALAIFGFLGLVITLAAALLRQLPDLFSAWREARSALRRGDGDSDSDDRTPAT